MSLQFFVENTQLFFLIFARVMALLQIAPLLSSGGIPQVVKISLSILSSFVLLPMVAQSGYPIPQEAFSYVLLLAGEALVGILLGFILVIVFSSFQVAGQLFSLQMGFGASEVFDPLAQIEIPLMGQYLNLMAMFVYVSLGGFQRYFLVALYQSFRTARAIDFLTQRDYLLRFMINSLGGLFMQALIMALPILGTLMLISITTGLFAKAAPQMNLLMLGFPISIGVAFLVILLILPILAESFSAVIDNGFSEVLKLLSSIQEARA